MKKTREREVQRISKEEERAAVKRMKSGKEGGPDVILVWRCLRERTFGQNLTQFWSVRGCLRNAEEVKWHFKNKGPEL